LTAGRDLEITSENQDRYICIYHLQQPGDKNAQEQTTPGDLESMVAEADRPNFTTLPAKEHDQEIVQNTKHNLYHGNFKF